MLSAKLAEQSGSPGVQWASNAFVGAGANRGETGQFPIFVCFRQSCVAESRPQKGSSWLLVVGSWQGATAAEAALLVFPNSPVPLGGTGASTEAPLCKLRLANIFGPPGFLCLGDNL